MVAARDRHWARRRVVIEVSLTRLVDLVGGRLHGAVPPEPPVVTAVTVDSRTAGPGSLFVALPGTHVDGHAFVPAAWRQGAAAALTSLPVPGGGGLAVQVPDALVALGRLARHVVEVGTASGLQVIGVTGSSGKTSTKDLLAAVLEPVGPTVAPYGNLNNELGVPLTVARVEPDTRFLVGEFGARGVGHIRYLCEIAPPRVGVVLNVGQAHVGEFGSQAAIARAKAELVQALPESGTAVLNADDPLVWAMGGQTAARVLAFSAAGDPGGPDAVWAADVTLDRAGRPRFVLHARRGGQALPPAKVALQLTGRHHVGNAAAAAGAALAVGVDLATAAAGLSAARTRSRWRMELQERADAVLVVNDSYNANPESMRAALATLVELGRDRPGRTWAVLGDMLELGPAAEAEHLALGRLAVQLGVDRLLATGGYATAVVAGAREAGLGAGYAEAYQDKAELTERVAGEARQGDVVLVKASRGLALDTVAEQLLAASAPPAADRTTREEPA